MIPFTAPLVRKNETPIPQKRFGSQRRLRTPSILKTGFLLFLLTVLPLPAQVPQSIQRLTKSLVAQYRAKNPDLSFEVAVAVLPLKDQGPALARQRVGETLSALLMSSLSRATGFHVVERGEDLKKNFKEIALAQSGLVDEQNAAKAGRLLAADLLVDGQVAESGDQVVITARLVSTEKAEVLATATETLARGEVLHEVEAYVTSAFSSPDGINFSYEAGVFLNLREGSRSAGRTSLLLGYRLSRIWNVGVGGEFFGTPNYFTENYAVTNVFPGFTAAAHQSNVLTRSYAFQTLGPKLFVDLNFPVSPRWRLGLRGEFGFMPGAMIIQDMRNFPVPVSLYVVASNSFQTTVTPQSFLVQATSSVPPVFGGGTAMADFVITKRLSLNLRAGFFAMSQFNPDTFSVLGFTQDYRNLGSATSFGDLNGTFAQLFKFNFNRMKTGNEIDFSILGVTASIGVSMHL